MTAGQPSNSQVTATPAKRGRFAFWRSLSPAQIAMWAVTVAWILYLAAVVNAPGASLASLDLNELGDFLAGGFAPLAFAWLIYGYFMQASELRLQREELQLQREEMANTRAELARTAAATEAANLLAERDLAQKLMPSFLLSVFDRGRNWIGLELQNNGGHAIEVDAGNHSGGWRLDAASHELGDFEHGQSRRLMFGQMSDAAGFPLHIAVEFRVPSDERVRAAGWAVDQNGNVTRSDWHRPRKPRTDA